MPITTGSFQTIPGSTGTPTNLGADINFDEAIIFFGKAGSNNTSTVQLTVTGESDPIPFSPGDKLILSGADGEELNFTQFQISSSTSGDGVTVIYQVYNPYA